MVCQEMNEICEISQSYDGEVYLDGIFWSSLPQHVFILFVFTRIMNIILIMNNMTVLPNYLYILLVRFEH